MIRDKRTFIAVNAVGAAATLLVLISWSLRPPSSLLFPPWFWRADAAFVFGVFIYNIARRMRGPIEPARWARGMTDRQLCIAKGLLIAVGMGAVFVVTVLRFTRP
jgi:hypothetical protein